MKRVLITGGAGFIGSHLCERLLNGDTQVVVIDNFSTGQRKNLDAIHEHSNFQLIEDSVLNAPLVDRLVERSDYVFHLAAAVGVKLIVEQPVQTIATNIRGSEILLESCYRWHRPVLLASTSEIYGKNKNAPFSEDADMVLGPTTKSRWSYACSKAIDEFLAVAYARAFGLPVTIVRLFNTVGPRQVSQYGMVLPTFVKQALAGEDITVYGTGEQTRTFCSVFDALDALIGLMNAKTVGGEVYNVGGKDEISILGLAEMVKQRTGSNSNIRVVSYDQAYEEGFEDMQRRVPNISKVGAAIGFSPKFGIEDIVDQVVNFYR